VKSKLLLTLALVLMAALLFKPYVVTLTSKVDVHYLADVAVILGFGVPWAINGYARVKHDLDEKKKAASEREYYRNVLLGIAQEFKPNSGHSLMDRIERLDKFAIDQSAINDQRDKTLCGQDNKLDRIENMLKTIPCRAPGKCPQAQP
jgi:hypothetical protein